MRSLPADVCAAPCDMNAVRNRLSPVIAIATIAGCSGATLSVASGDSAESGDQVIDFLVFLLRVIVGYLDMG